MRTRIWGIWFVIIVGVLIAFSPPVRAQNPVPLISQPLVPTIAAPGGPSFTLVVNGTGFVSGSVVNWNGSARLTTFVSGSTLKAAITAADVALAGTASVTVTNPTPAGGVSGVAFFQITNLASTVILNRSDFSAANPVTYMVAADFNGDGKLDLAFVHGGGSTLSVVLGKGDGSFQAPVSYPTGGDSTHLATGDFNGDGKLDLVSTDGADNTVSILLGNGDGTFQARSAYSAGTFPIAVATGDFNGDGKLDLAVTDASANAVSILLGNGNGTFQAPVDYTTGRDPQAVFVADFNGDGKLDLAVGNLEDNSVSILLGNGNGVFQAHVDYPVASFAQWVAAADLNGDGKLDLVVASFNASTVSVLLGNGNGTFQTHVDYTTGGTTGAVGIGDFNGDGKLDLVTSNGKNGSFNSSGSISFFLGNGDGTFQTHVDFSAGGSEDVVIGDFNGDGKLDLAIDDLPNSLFSVLLQAPTVTGPGATLSGTNLSFSSQPVGSSSTSQSVTLSNNGSAALTISNIAITGTNVGDFTETSTCPSSPTTLGAGANCAIAVTFQPTITGTRSASVTFTDDAANSPQSVSLTGVATDFSLSVATGSNCPSGGNCSVSATVSAGQTATYNLQVGPVNGLNGTVTLGCTDTLAKSTCAVSSTSITVNGTTATAFTVTVTTTASSALAPLSKPPTWKARSQPMLNFHILFAFVIVFAGSMAAARNSRRRLVPVLSLLLVSLVWMAGCGGGGSNGGGGGTSGTPSGTVTITGTSSGVTHSVSLNLTVN